MSKVATYLRGHLAGEVDFRTDLRAARARDAGILAIAPEMVVSPRNTSDIRKTARFSWQLSERGHALPLVARGAGYGISGGAVGRGAQISLAAHMNTIFEYDSKQRLARLQPGVTIQALQSALALQGTGVLALDGLDSRGTIGGAIADNAAGYLAGKYGSLAANVSQLEVVLANGDVLQTGKISKRELSRKKGQQDLEGDIYRGVETILEDYADEISTIHERDQTGYNSIVRVRDRDGSIDLTPLFIGNQGTLGIISEMILRVDFRSQHLDTAALVFASADTARDMLDELRRFAPAFVKYFDAALVRRAVQVGYKAPWFQEVGGKAPQAVILVGFDDFNARARAKGKKKLEKLCGGVADVSLVLDDDAHASLSPLLDIARYSTLPDRAGVGMSPLLSDWFVPPERFEDFTKALAALGNKLRVDLPIAVDGLTELVSAYPLAPIAQASDRQKLMRLFDETARLVHQYGGAIVGQHGEGRLLSRFAYECIGARRVDMYRAIRKLFDPLGTLNPGVKQLNDVRQLAGMIDGTLRF
ncbi:FAD-binding oxidoreductase [Candidatus Southlakia epibionticum]|uniref:D-lactate dehydrogenase (cytochrome) n=1 Tax=Candidatus Southlakia epibionticum TaxID=3043284 RepID=A0ABY8WUW0_9BACT|nr:FAD-binding oxidoreductase [Candidatus Saccharimonadaceae bacterium ML1]